jgi:hypothetical protein
MTADERRQQDRAYRKTERGQTKSREAQTRWRKQHPKEQSKKTGNNVKRLMRWANTIKEATGCVTCGEKDVRCLDFHHTGVDKTSDISVAVQKGWCTERLSVEINKCIILCANCHRKLYISRVV